MSESKEKYFNVPVQLFAGFMEDSEKCLKNVFDYSVYIHSTDLTGNEKERFKASCEWYEVNAGNTEQSIQNGKQLTRETPDNSPKVGLKLSTFWDYYKNEKTDFEKLCLLGFLGIKSILQNKAYCKIDNKFWLSRMDGKAKSASELWELSESIKKYSNEYQTVKIKTELRNNWGLTTYSRHTRGFYVSFSLTLEQLVYEAEKRRKSTIDKQNREREKEAIKAALKKLYSNTS